MKRAPSSISTRTLPPDAQGLYDPINEHDACGVGFIVNIAGKKSHQTLSDALQILVNLQHRGACGCEDNTGDGAGVLFQIPDKFLRREATKLGIQLPEQGDYAVGMVFLPSDIDQRLICEEEFVRIVEEEGQTVLGWRDVPRDNSSLGQTAIVVEPSIRQIFIGRGPKTSDRGLFEWKLYVIRKRVEAAVRNSDLTQKRFFYVPSLSNKTIVYKGLLLATQMDSYYADLSDPDVETAIAMVHQRYSTNTFPTWDLAHPFRYIAHNGEINTVRGNQNWMRARQSVMGSKRFKDDVQKLFPIIPERMSDSAAFDCALELLHATGRSLPQPTCCRAMKRPT